ncbi:Tetratricopeptide repeat protein 17 [Orchesella cincta]|uniref:Tetratricopeptide repeat protein 17 n=1 Tax=Orchesella cincta TaxID=48709 RepID=A0A1D2NMT1_ORCCI|nr:Tetratricopeptide repeat protein 17 [Orchesella cincta]
MPSHGHDCFGWSAYSYFLTLYVLSLHILDTNTRSSPHWRLVEENGRNTIVPDPTPTMSISGSPSGGNSQSLSYGQGRLSHVSSDTQNESLPYSRLNRPSSLWISNSEEEVELVLQILATTVINSGSWIKNGDETYCRGCTLGGGASNPSLMMSSDYENISGGGIAVTVDDDSPEVLDCGRPANFTYYDQLIGVANRHNHPHIPEPQVAMVFRKKGSKKDTIDLNTLERKLRKAKKEKPSSVQLYNQIGNFWRIKGHTLRAIECFRRALAVAPNNPEVLHNLARLLLTLQYLDDALFLARRSLELQAPDRNAWQQHFTLGEILKAYGHHQEAVLHFKHTLELRPDHAAAQQALRELENLLAGTGLHICTLLIIVFLVLGVLLMMLSNLDENEAPDLTRPPPRHFSRALAMRSLKLGISPRALRAKRLP